MSVSIRLGQHRRRQSPLLLLISIIMVLAGVGLFIFELTDFTQGENRLPAGLSVAGVNVGGQLQNRAQAAVEQAYTDPVTLYYRENPIILNPDTVGFRMSSNAMIADAMTSGEAGGGFWRRFANYLFGQDQIAIEDIPLRADYQTTALRAFLEDIALRYDRPGGRAGYDPSTLMTFPGEQGYILDIDEAMTLIDAALRRPTDRIVQLPVGAGEFSQPSLNTLEQLIISYLDTQGFVYDGLSSVASVYIQDLTTGDELHINSDVAFTAASTTKVGILIDYYRILDHEPTQDDAWLMANSLLCSQNSTSNLIMSNILGGGDQFEGIASVTNTLQTVGATNSYITAPFVDGSAGQVFGSIEAPDTNPNPNFDTGADIYNQTTAEDLGTLFTMLYDCANYESGLMVAYPNDFTARECRQMLELMSANDLERLLQGGIPPNVRISHKNGWFGESTGNAGIVFPPNGRDYVIAVFLWEDTGARGFQDYVRLWPLVEDISRAAWNYFVPEQVLRSRRTDLPNTAAECAPVDSSGAKTHNYLPPYGQVDLNNINGWRDGSATTPQPVTVPTATPRPLAASPTPAPANTIAPSPTAIPVTPTSAQPTLTPLFGGGLQTQ